MVDWSAPAPKESDKRLFYEGIMGLLIGIGVALPLVGDRVISLRGFGLGAFLTTLFYVSMFTIPVQLFNNRTREIGTGGGLVVIAAIITVIWVIVRFFDPPTFVLTNFVLGCSSILVAAPALRLAKRFSDRRKQNTA